MIFDKVEVFSCAEAGKEIISSSSQYKPDNFIDRFEVKWNGSYLFFPRREQTGRILCLKIMYSCTGRLSDPT